MTGAESLFDALTVTVKRDAQLYFMNNNEQPPSKYGAAVDGVSGRLDLNQRPLGPEPSALPGCATPRTSST